MAASPDNRLMPEFINELARFCRGKHGRVTALARHLGVAQPHVSAWLTRRQEPSGEHTLRIQEWWDLEQSRKAGPPPVVPARRSRKVRPPGGSPPSPEPVPVWLL